MTRAEIDAYHGYARPTPPEAPRFYGKILGAPDGHCPYTFTRSVVGLMQGWLDGYGVEVRLPGRVVFQSSRRPFFPVIRISRKPDEVLTLSAYGHILSRTQP